MRQLILRRCGPGNTVQDLGREGFLAQGLSRGGAADPRALAEGAALLSQPAGFAALEIVTGIEAEVTAPSWIALTGAPKNARRDGQPLAWNACQLLQPGERLSLGPGGAGNFAYLHLAGGIATPPRVGGRGAHLAAGLGAPLADGARLPLGPDPAPDRRDSALPAEERYDGGVIRVLSGPQTALFAPDVLDRFFETPFTRTAWGNRQGVKLGHGGKGFRPSEGLNLVSEVIVPGDIQVTGDGTPYVLGPECQTIGGYPRIGTVLPQDLPNVMQATPGSRLHFRLVTLEEALATHRPVAEVHWDARNRMKARADIHEINLLAHNLISGVAIDILDDEDDS